MIPHYKLPTLALVLRGSPEPIDIGEFPALTLELAPGLRMEGPLQPAKCRCVAVSRNVLDLLENELCPKSCGNVVTHLGFDQRRRFYLLLRLQLE